jgi:hypothetical protein
MRYFSSPGSLRRPMYSGGDDPKGPGFPIRISADQSLFAAPHGFSQRTTSFIASRCQGIHQTPLRRLINPASNGQHPDATQRGVSTPTHNTRTQTPDPGPRQHCITQSARPDDPLGPDPQHPHREYQAQTRDHPVYALHHVQQPTGHPSHGRPALHPHRHNAGGANSVSAIEPALQTERPAQEWWAREDLNFRPHAYQARALTN